MGEQKRTVITSFAPARTFTRHWHSFFTWIYFIRSSQCRDCHGIYFAAFQPSHKFTVSDKARKRITFSRATFRKRKTKKKQNKSKNKNKNRTERELEINRQEIENQTKPRMGAELLWAHFFKSHICIEIYW